MHMESHQDRLRTQSLCDQCPTLWNSSESLKSHCDSVHYSKSSHLGLPGENSTLGYMCEEKEKVSCGFCSKSFKSKSTLKIHMRSHCGENGLGSDKGISGEKVPSFLCNICQRCFYDERGLNLHKLIHSRKKSYRKSSRILARNLVGDENNKRILLSKTSTYTYEKEVSEYCNKDRKVVRAKSFKKYQKRVTTWRGKEKKNANTVVVKETRKIKDDDKTKKLYKTG